MRHAMYRPAVETPALPHVNLSRRELHDATLAAGHAKYFPEALYVVGADTAELVASMNVAADSIRANWPLSTADQKRFCNWLAGVLQPMTAGRRALFDQVHAA